MIVGSKHSEYILCLKMYQSGCTYLYLYLIFILGHFSYFGQTIYSFLSFFVFSERIFLFAMLMVISY